MKKLAIIVKECQSSADQVKEEEVDNSLGSLKLEEVLQVHEKEETKVGANVLSNHTKCNANKGDRETLKTNQEGWKCGDQSHQKLSQFPRYWAQLIDKYMRKVNCI